MRRALFLALATAFVLSNAGCFVPIYSSDPTQRVEQLLYASDDLRQIEQEWRRAWFTDQPSHLTPERVHGGVY